VDAALFEAVAQFRRRNCATASNRAASSTMRTSTPRSAAAISASEKRSASVPEKM